MGVYKGFAPPSVDSMHLDVKPVIGLAVPAILTQLATPIGQAYVTRSMAEFGEGAVAGMAIIGRLMPVAFGVIFALSGAIGPIIGQNYGAKQFDRVREAFRDAMVFTATVVVLMTVLMTGIWSGTHFIGAMHQQQLWHWLTLIIWTTHPIFGAISLGLASVLTLTTRNTKFRLHLSYCLPKSVISQFGQPALLSRLHRTARCLPPAHLRPH